MKKLLVLALSLPFAGCVVGDTGSTPPGDDQPPVDPPPGDPNAISGHITSDRTITGAATVTGSATVDSGVTLTLAAGATLNFKAGAGLSVEGTLKAEGTSASKVNIQPDAGATAFSGVNVKGTLSLSYAVMHGGSINTQSGSTTTITDTLLYGASGDFLIMNGGSVTMTYSQLGAPQGTTDTTHCNMHFGGSGNTINITKSNIVGSPYGLMFYGGTGAVFTDNNWMAGAANINVDTSPGVAGDFSRSYFDKVPTPGAGATLTLNNLSQTPLTDAGVRP